MYIELDKITYSPSDLTLFMDSPFASWMEHSALFEPKLLSLVDEEDMLMSVLKNKGIEHEQNILNSFKDRGLNIASIKKNSNTFEDTFSAMQSGVDIIYQAELSLPPFKGYADFLVKVDGKSRLGDFHYEVWDTKLSKTVKPNFLIQLCCYAEMLKALQGRKPDQIVVVLGTGESMRFCTNNYFYYYLNLKNRFLKTHQTFLSENRPNPADSNSWGRWSDYTQSILVEADHLSQIATITKSQIKKLNQTEIYTQLNLIESTQERVKGINTDVFARLKAQAKIQKNSAGLVVPLYQILPHDPNKKIGLSLLPPASPLDVYFDIEGFPLEDGGLEYLWGSAYLDDKGLRQYKDFWAHDEEQEKIAFKSFIEWAFERWQCDPHMHIYHYANYEIAACRKLMGRYGICEDMVDALLRNEVFVDLYKIVKGCLLLGEPRYSIKNVEHLYRGKRNTEVGSGGDSVVVYEHWRELPDGDTWETSTILTSIRDYNIDDCNSTQELVDWLRIRQQENSIAYLGKTEHVPAPENEKITEYTQLRDTLLNKANDLKTKNLEKQSKIATLLAWVLEFHRREKKPMYWRLFDRLGANDEELLDDIDCLAHCVRTERPAYKLKPKDRNLCYEYRFDPNQEFKAASEKYKVLGQERADGKNVSVEFIKEDSNLAEGLIVLKTGESLENVVTLIPEEDINADPIPAAIASVAKAFERDQLEKTAIYSFLMRKPPRVTGLENGAPIAPSHDPAERLNQIISVVKNMDNSYLAIQGPPGSGKTYTAKHIIAALLKTGKRIGISSNSHKAINHLLINTVEYCKEKNIAGYFACTRNTDDALSALGITVYDNKSIAGNLQPSCVIGTTAWGFARDDLEQAFDYLFIDEAGQVSVANLIAMSRSAKNIILMGDQMQLGQPSQGSHPEESGASVLDYLLHTSPTINESMGIFLGITYRMHSAVNQFISEAIYEGKLESAQDNDLQCIQVPEDYQGSLNTKAGIIAVPVDHEGNTQASDEEVERIVLLANELIGRMLTTKSGEKRPIDWDDMLFVAPYNHQVNKLRLALDEKAKVGSVDKFQGQEASIVFLSMCASNANESPRGFDFLFNKNRINVAISRAQCIAVVVYSPTLLNAPIRNSNQMEMMNLFCMLIEGRTKVLLKDFFDRNVDDEIQKIQDRFKNPTGFIKDIQNKINRLDNLISYNSHIKDNEIKLEINRLLAQASPYSDLSPEAAYNSFPGNYLSKVFELAVFKLLKEVHCFDLCRRDKPEPPDYVFLHDSIQHQVECITRTSSLMDKYFGVLPHFNQYLEAAKIFKEVNGNRAKLYNSNFENAFTTPAITMLFYDLSSVQKEKLKYLLQADTLDLAQKKFLDWVYVTRYARLFFKDCLSVNILEELENIGFPDGLCGDEINDQNTKDFILNGIAKAVIDKAQKIYSKVSGKPITLAISFSLGRNFISVPNPEIMMNFICQNLGRAINEQKKTPSDNDMLNNLYAIVIDTTWYNWFPNIAIKRHNAKFPSNFNNCYGCIYNTGHILVKQSQLIYDCVPFIGYFD